MKKLFTKIKESFANLLTTVRRFFRKIYDSKFMVKVRELLSIFPDWMASRISYRKRKLIWGFVFVLPLIIGFIYFFLIPFIMSIRYSFSFVENVAGQGIKTVFVGFDNYTYIFTQASTVNGTFAEILVSAVIQIITNIPIILIFSLIIAVVLNSKFKGRAFVRAVFFMPVIFNSQAIDLAMTSATALTQFADSVTTDIFSNMFSFQDYLLNANIPVGAVGFLGSAVSRIYDVVSYSGVQILIFLSAIQSVPKHLYEAAKMEGATQYEMFWKITFPMVSPMMLTAAVYTVVDSFLTSPLVTVINSYFSPNKSTSGALGINGQLSNYGINAAMSWIFALVSVVIIGLVLVTLSKAVFYYDE